MHATRTLGFCFLMLLVNSGLALECHTCNSHKDKGCDQKVFKPVSSTKDLKKCDESFAKTVTDAQSIFAPDVHPISPDQLNPHQNNNESYSVCIKLTIASQGKGNVTFRSCSILGRNTHAILDTLAKGVGTTIEDYHECSNKNLCNDAKVALPLFSAYLMAALAIMLVVKF